ncbi:RNA polymerase sigma factor [Mucilaginibacter sp. RS28]|uniref:RNA polymerase sigma factor n=1 Tax=Mucilaginibacter straminoryzae TaxID=2932774 RepID=A0A9X2B7V7_9SPHI|nr:RNA polymerase sigma factor [Mucilaginibacter straminoryzae]MCJ8208801.1 RNA polymerase sigma factor [Mucilaginibacter straminoryzae]
MICEKSLTRIFEGCKNNDRKQQDLLYKVMAPKMLAVCMRYTSDRDEAQDVLQEGFIKLFKNLHNFRGEGSIEGWIRRIMTHTAISRYRKLKPMVLTEEIGEYSTPFFSTAQNNPVEAKELMNIIQELPGNYRSVFNLYAIEGYSHQEIGNMLGITELLSRTTLHRARGILKKKVLQLEGFRAN